MDDRFGLIVLLLAAAVTVVTLFRRLKLPSIIAYLIAGIAAGPAGFGWVQDTEGIQHLAEFGIVFLLFSLGLEFSIPRLVALRKIVFGAGPIQVLLTGALVSAMMLFLDFSITTAIITGAALALSSTAIVIRELIARGDVNTSYGRSATGILLFQDLAAVIMLVLLPALAMPGVDPVPETLFTLLKAFLLFIGIFVIGKWVLPHLLEETVRTRSDEVFVMTALLLALAAAWVTHALSLSMALGAFLAGMMLGESHFRHQIESDIRPFRDLLLGLFFMGVGMLLDPVLFLDHWHWILLGTLGLILFKGVLITLLLVLLKERLDTAVRSGTVLAQGGEFGFVLVTLAVKHTLLTADEAGLIVSIGVLSMMLTPSLIQHSASLARKIQTGMQAPADSPLIDPNTCDHVVLCGYGRVGQMLARYLEQFDIKTVALDSDLVRIHEASLAGEPILFGDATRKEILEKAGLGKASLLVITFDSPIIAEKIIHTARAVNPEVRILVRTQDDTHLDTLQTAGATEVVPETLEASLMLVSHALVLLGIPFNKVISMLRHSRKNRYKLLQGFYHGDAFPSTDSSGNPYQLLHAVALEGQASAIGKSLAELPLDGLNVTLKKVKRDGSTFTDFSHDFELQCKDILVLYGSIEALEKAEQYLLAGKSKAANTP